MIENEIESIPKDNIYLLKIFGFGPDIQVGDVIILLRRKNQKIYHEKGQERSKKLLD